MRLLPFRRGKRTKRDAYVDPTEVLLDASNLPSYDRAQMEGRIATPIGRRVFAMLAVIVSLMGLVALARIGNLQLIEGQAWAEASAANRLRHSIIFTERGIIYDRTGTPLAWNTISEEKETPYAIRAYATSTGIGHVLGYVRPPRADSSGNFYQTDYVGVAGSEALFDETLHGENGVAIVETSASGVPISRSTLSPPVSGNSVTLSVDARVSELLYDEMATLAGTVAYQGGAGVLIDVETGELVALASFPEISSSVLADGNRREEISALIDDPRRPFLHRAIAGLYTPGSIVKPFLALGALMEDIIRPNDIIVSHGYISVPNPYNPSNPTIFRDWRAHGATDMEHAIAVSSDVYFYTIGGGYEGRTGLGISGIEKYLRLFGIGESTGIALAGEAEGTIPNPAWKAATFPSDPDWRLGDTYNTSIGQYGTQVTPIEAARATAAIANGGKLLVPHIEKDAAPEYTDLGLDPDQLAVIQRGMRRAVQEGTAGALSLAGIPVAGKTGTAEVGSHKQYVNSWVIGFFPYEKPRYALALIMERGPTGSPTGAPYAAGQFLKKLLTELPEYGVSAAEAQR